MPAIYYIFPSERAVMAPRHSSYLVLGFLLIVLATPACYTLLKHPRVKRGRVYVEVESDQCASCHHDNEPESYHILANRATAQAKGWKEYYSIPWWYSGGWQNEPEQFKPVPD